MSTNKKTPSQKTSSQSRRSPVSNRKPKTSKPGGKNQRLSNGLQECVPEPPKRSSSSLLGKKEVAKINLHTVRKLDSSVKSIKSTVPQVVLYQYESISNTWVSVCRYALCVINMQCYILFLVYDNCGAILQCSVELFVHNYVAISSKWCDHYRLIAQ